jgi:hypothetical protein
VLVFIRSLILVGNGFGAQDPKNAPQARFARIALRSFLPAGFHAKIADHEHVVRISLEHFT